jgi:transcription elongation factor Elf1
MKLTSKNKIIKCGAVFTLLVSAVATDVVDVTAFVIDTTAGVVESGAEYVDEQTDEMQDEESPKE